MKIIPWHFSFLNWQACFQRRNSSDDQWVSEGCRLLQLVKHRGTCRIFWSYASCIFHARKFTDNSIFEGTKIGSNHSFLVVPWLRLLFAWSFTAEACIQSRASSCGICGWKPGTGTGFSVSASVFPGHCHSKNALFIYHECCIPKQLIDLGNKTLLVLSFCVSTFFFSALPSLISMKFGIDAATHLKWRYGKCQTCIWNAFEALTFQNLKEI